MELENHFGYIIDKNKTCEVKKILSIYVDDDDGIFITKGDMDDLEVLGLIKVTEDLVRSKFLVDDED